MELDIVRDRRLYPRGETVHLAGPMAVQTLCGERIWGEYMGVFGVADPLEEVKCARCREVARSMEKANV